VHTHTTLAGVIGRIAAVLARVPIIIHTMHGSFFFVEAKLLYKVLFFFVEIILGRFTDFVFTLNNSDRLKLINNDVVVKSKTQCLNGEGVDLNRFNSENIDKEEIQKIRMQLGIRNAGKVIGYVGRPIRKKGLYELFEAFQIINLKLKNTQLLIVGDVEPCEPDKDTMLNLKKIANHKRLENKIIFAGKQSDVPQLISLMDVLILPSYGEGEGFGMTLVEAAAMSKPTIATDIPCFRDAVLNNVTGILVPPKDPNTLASAIMKILANDNLANEMGRKGRERAENVFDNRLVVEKQLNIYKKLFDIRGLSIQDL
jgi:glycosyltransferase involved in cell wall biosynthesis